MMELKVKFTVGGSAAAGTELRGEVDFTDGVNTSLYLPNKLVIVDMDAQGSISGRLYIHKNGVLDSATAKITRISDGCVLIPNKALMEYSFNAKDVYHFFLKLNEANSSLTPVIVTVVFIVNETKD